MRVLDEWLLTPARAAIHLPTRTAVVADLHLGYDRVRHRGGEAIPHRAMATELAPLSDLLCRKKVTRLVVAGDLFEDGRCARDEMVAELRGWLDATGIELVGVVPGNHDRGVGKSSLPVVAAGVELGRWRIVHGDGERPEGPFVHGHEHPCLRWRDAQGPCYLVAADHLVLPAYSVDAAGGNVLSQARWQQHRCCVIAGEAVLDFGAIADLRRRLQTTSWSKARP